VRERLCLLALVGLACLAGPAFAEPLYEWQWTIAPGILLSNQAPTIAALPDGALLVCWPAGSTEKARDVQIYCSRSGPGSRSWERPRPVVQRGERAGGSWLRNLTLGNPVLLLDHQRHLWLFYAAVDAPFGWSGSHVDYKVSNDLGKTWSSSRRLVAGWGNLPRNSALALGGDGRVLLPVYHELYGTHGYTLELTINRGVIEKVESRRIPGGDHLQPALVWAEPRRVVAYLRSASQRVPHVLRSEYDQASDRWSKPEALALPNSKSALDAVNTGDGGILLAYNDSPTQRTPLSLAYSRDSRRFTKIWDFEIAPDLRFSYPALIRAADGTYHLVYRAQERWAPAAIKHVMFNQEWLTLRLRAAGIPPAGIPKGN
jgi:predicted neuraminidase